MSRIMAVSFDALAKCAPITLPRNAYVYTPAATCPERRYGIRCMRPGDHGGRHAWIRMSTGVGVVMQVWGEDVHAAARAMRRPPRATL